MWKRKKSSSRKVKRFVNKIPSVKTLDDLWREACMARDGNKCVYTYEIYKTVLERNQTVLQVHHLMRKSTFRLRWDLTNGITITKGIHYGVAHSNSPTVENQFRGWALDRLPAKDRDALELLERMKSCGGVDRFAVKLYLEKKLMEYSKRGELT